ncbi:hypothetical protein L2E82_28210 [Cichorium intybus]|uniref:Uncharacterized protein n=1 Tax=Cichorium intybus TaxID=13427 RepID=A0ACB9CV58_CICIN|nr:hypothetical protein L2E82_28210 [Cichorium intybus]
MHPTRHRFLTYRLKIRRTDQSLGFADLGRIYFDFFYSRSCCGYHNSKRPSHLSLYVSTSLINVASKTSASLLLNPMISKYTPRFSFNFIFEKWGSKQ